jgi:hypothetical protein
MGFGSAYSNAAAGASDAYDLINERNKTALGQDQLIKLRAQNDMDTANREAQRASPIQGIKDYTPGAGGLLPAATEMPAAPASVPAGESTPTAQNNRFQALKQPQAQADQSSAETARLTGIGRGPANMGVGYFVQSDQVRASTMPPAVRLAEMRKLNPVVAETQTNSESQRLARPPAPSQASASGMQPLSVRNNNPGNLKYIGQPGATPGPTLPDGTRFAVFQDAATGASAAENDLAAKMAKGNNTVAGIINVYSPANAQGNTPQSTANYISRVATELGVSPTQPLPASVIPRMAQAMFKVEGGSGTPIAQGQAPQGQQTQAPTQQFSAGPAVTSNVLPEIAQADLGALKNQHALMAQRAQNARTPEDYDKWKSAADMTRAQYAEAQLYQMAQGGDLMGMVNAAAAHGFGVGMGVADAGNGNVVMTRNGVPIPGMPPIPQDQAIKDLYSTISPMMRQMSMALRQKQMDSAIDTEAKIKVENAKGRNELDRTALQGKNAAYQQAQQALIDAGMDANRFDIIPTQIPGEMMAKPKYGGATFTFTTPGGAQGASLGGKYTASDTWKPVVGLAPRSQ